MPKTKLVEDEATVEYRMDALAREIKKDFDPKKDHIVAVIVQPNGLFFGANLCQRIGYSKIIVDTIHKEDICQRLEGYSPEAR